MYNSKILFHNDKNIFLQIPNFPIPPIESNQYEYGIFKLIIEENQSLPIIRIKVKNGFLYDSLYRKEWCDEYILYNLSINNEIIFYIVCDNKAIYDIEIELDCDIENINTTIYSCPPLIDVNTNLIEINDLSSYFDNNTVEDL
jgi:hypothetical protein